MNFCRVSLVLVFLALAVGCSSSEPAPEPEPEAAPEPVAEQLPAPFTAEQIRDEWVEGLVLTMERTGENGEARLETWTVAEADEFSARIEFVALDDDGEPVRAQTTQSYWSELRDHSVFPPGSAARMRTTRDTALGTLEGWLYMVKEENGIVTDYFFADTLPGAPVAMESRRDDGTVVASLAQIARERP